MLSIPGDLLLFNLSNFVSTSLNERDISAMFFVIMGLIVPVIGLVVP